MATATPSVKLMHTHKMDIQRDAACTGMKEAKFEVHLLHGSGTLGKLSDILVDISTGVELVLGVTS